MILSRFWSVLVALLVAATVAVLQLSLGAYDRLRTRTLTQGLASDSQLVSWYLRNAARDRAAQLIRVTAKRTIAEGLARSNRSPSALAESRRAVRAELAEAAKELPPEHRFDALFAVNRDGAVVAQLGFPQADKVHDFRLGSYAVVTDALHGYIRDDTLLLGQLYRVVARPVEWRAGTAPVGAIVGARKLDDAFAQEVSARTGVALAVYFQERRVATGAPAGFDRSLAGAAVGALPGLKEDDDYAKVGRTGPLAVSHNLSAVFTRLPGEAWQLGGGFAVMREAPALGALGSLLQRADRQDREQVSWWLVAGAGLAVALIGLALTWFDHSRPLRRLLASASGVAEARRTDLPAESLRGLPRRIAIEFNRALEHVAMHSDSRPGSAALSQVFDDSQPPPMSAFGLVGAPFGPSPAGTEPETEDSGAIPAGAGAEPAAPPAAELQGAAPGVAAPPLRRSPAPRAAAPASDVEPGWREVFEQFSALRAECGEPTDELSYERFCAKLRRNRDDLMQKHGAKRVEFSVYEKNGRAALRAKPIRQRAAGA